MFLTVPQVAELAQCCDETVYSAIRAGRLRASRPGRKYLVRPESVDAWIASLEQEAS